MTEQFLNPLPSSDPIIQSNRIASDSLLIHISKSREIGRSVYWSREVSSLEYLFHAPNLVLKRMREHCHWVTGISSYQYAEHHFDTPPHHAMVARIAALVNRAPALEIKAERESYAGFGFPYEGKIYNADNLKYHEVIIGLTENLGRNLELGKMTFLEIGSGFGGLADTIISHYPGSKLILVDLPEVLLLSWTFLGAWYPEKRIEFFDSSKPITSDSFDILIVPNNLMGELIKSNLKIDVLINTVSFQEMTTQQVSEYVTHASEMRIPYIYSLNRDRSKYNEEITSVSGIIAEKYALRELEILETEYTAALKSPKMKHAKVKNLSKGEENIRYRHILGSLR
jgi:putative sugar O-methyltransferase